MISQSPAVSSHPSPLTSLNSQRHPDCEAESFFLVKSTARVMQFPQMSHIQRSGRGWALSLISKQISLLLRVMDRLIAGTCLDDRAPAAIVPNQMGLLGTPKA